MLRGESGRYWCVDEGHDGKFFEGFCVWFLENDLYWKTKVAEVWLWKDWPKKFQDDDFGKYNWMENNKD